MVVETKKLESLEINIKKRIFKLNGEDMKGVSRLDIDYDNGRWTLFVTKDVVYSQTTSNNTTTRRERRVKMNPIESLERCPMCGGGATTLNVDDYNTRKYRTVCKECGTSTRACVSVNESLRVWNQRISNR